MAVIRWMRISEELSRLGFAVDIIVNSDIPITQKSLNLRFVSKSIVKWSEYDVVKTLFHNGFKLLSRMGGSDHPFIISKMGSVVGANDNTEGVHFYGEERQDLFETQQLIADRSRFVTILTEQSSCLWNKEHGNKNNLLRVPTGVDESLPDPASNPYKEFGEKIAVYIGNIYCDTQVEVNRLWQLKLNKLGSILKNRGIRLCHVGPGKTNLLDRKCVTSMGAVDYSAVWDYHHYADVGIVFAQGETQHNESSKIYYYLRSGLPVVSEEPVPNNHLIHETGLGCVAKYDDVKMMADMIESVATDSRGKQSAMSQMIRHHSWKCRSMQYGQLLQHEFLN